MPSFPTRPPADLAIIATRPEMQLDGADAPLFRRPAGPVNRLPSRPDISKLSPEEQRATRMAEDGEGGVALTVAEDAPEEVQREVAAAIEPFVPGSIESVERYIEQAAEIGRASCWESVCQSV